MVLWRHGQTTWNAERRFQGQSDIPLDETGQAQAERAARLLAALRPDLIVSSDLSRAASTAAPLARLTGLEVMLDKDLRERHGGCWEGLTDTEIRERYPEAHATWTPPDGEPTVVVAERVAAALQRAATTVPERGTGPLRNGNPRGNPNLAPRCGARWRVPRTGDAERAMPVARR